MKKKTIFGSNLDLIRDKWQMLQEDFANLFTDMNRFKISSYNTGKTKPNIDFFIQLEDLTGVAIYDLYTRQILIEEIPDKPLGKGEIKTTSRSSGSADLEERVSRIEELLKNSDKKKD